MSEVEAPENVFDLATQVDAGDSYLVGYVAIVKFLSEDGEVCTRFVAHEMNNYEIVGILQAHLDVIRQENVIALYPAAEEEDEGE